MTKIAILGANGRLGRAVAKAFLAAGYEVHAVTRNGKLPAGLEGAVPAAADAMDRDALVRATQGAEIVFNGLNPPYTDWKAKCLPMARNVMAACRIHGATHLFPGNVYNFGAPLPVDLSETLAFQPTTRKGAIRVEMERLFEAEALAASVRTVVLRAGDFFGDSGTGSWFDLIVTQKIGKGVFTAPGAAHIVHEWAYLPDLAEAFVALADRRGSLGAFETFHFPGHAITALEMKAAMETAIGRKLKLATVPWWALRAGSPFVPMWREIAEMAYLQFQPHRLVSDRREGVIGTIPHTPLDQAVAQALADLDLMPGESRAKKRAA